MYAFGWIFGYLIGLSFSITNTACLVVEGFNKPKIVECRKVDDDDQTTSIQYVLHRNQGITTFKKNHKTDNQAIGGSNNSFMLRPIQKVKSAITTTFLPTGYPKRTPDGYLSYSIWSWIQDLSTQLRGVLATQRVLEGVGVGREGATALSASLNFIVRDGFGMASTLLFTALASSKFRADVKRWRLVADIVNDVGITLEVCATLVPRHLFLPMICAGNMCKAICGVAAGACNGAINLHWAKGSDISDINAKFGAQHTVTGSLGLLFAAIFARSVSTVPGAVLWSLYSLLTLAHIYANMKCLRLIAFDYLNTIRMDMIVNNFLEQYEQKRISSRNGAKIKNYSTKDKVPLENPTQISKRERLFFGIGLFQQQPKIRMGTSFQTIHQSIQSHNKDEPKTSSLLNLYMDQLSQDNYCVVCGTNNEINIGFTLNADITIQIKAYLMACMVRNYLKGLNSKEKIQFITDSNSLSQYLEDAKSKLKVCWPIFVQSLAVAGWDFDKIQLDTEDYCISVSQ